VRLLRAPLPAPEELAEVAERAPLRAERAPRGAARTAAAPSRDGAGDGQGEGVWFRLNLGRNGNADPRWLLPFLCRRGHVTRQEIGRIRVLDRETRFEVAPYAASRFANAARRPTDEDDRILIEAAAGAWDAARRRPTAPRAPQPPPRRERPPRDKAAEAASPRRRD
jgi:ATP-dependent RNA helicase DeaD